MVTSSTADAVLRQPPLWLLVAISALAPITMNGVLPANTAVMRDFSTDYTAAQLALTVYLVASMISQSILGNLADTYGRRPVMIGALTLFGVGGLLCAAAGSIETLLAGRFVQGFGSSVCVFLTRTILRDVHPKDKAASAIGYMVTAMMVAPLFGPAVFGWITDVSSWRIMYLLLAIAGFGLAFLSNRYQQETLVVSDKPVQSHWQSNKALLTKREFLAYVFIMSGSVGVYYCYLAGAPFVVMELRDHSATAYGTWFSLVAIGYLAGNFIAGRFSEACGTQRMIVLSMVPLIIGVVLFWIFSGMEHLIGLFLPMQFIALSNGMCLPNLTSAAMSVRTENAAGASGLLGTIQIATAIVLTFVVSALLKNTALPLFILITVCGIASLAGLWLLLDKRSRTWPGPGHGSDY